MTWMNLDEKERFPQDSEMAKKITERVTEFVALDDQPISVVKIIGFRLLLEPLNHLDATFQTLPYKVFLRCDAGIGSVFGTCRYSILNNLDQDLVAKDMFGPSLL